MLTRPATFDPSFLGRLVVGTTMGKIDAVLTFRGICLAGLASDASLVALIAGLGAAAALFGFGCLSC